MNAYTAPWERTYASDSNPVPDDVELPWKPTEEPAVTTPTNSVPSSEPPVAAAGASVASAMKDAIEAAQKAAVLQVESTVINALRNTVPAAPDAPTLEPKDVTNAAARGRAVRSLVYGLGLTIFWALVTAIGDAVSGGTVDFFTKTGWISVATLAIGTVAHAVLSYAGRIKFSPNTPE